MNQYKPITRHDRALARGGDAPRGRRPLRRDGRWIQTRAFGPGGMAQRRDAAWASSGEGPLLEPEFDAFDWGALDWGMAAARGVRPADDDELLRWGP